MNKFIFAFVTLISITFPIYASTIIYAEGRATSPVAEHVVLQNARRRLFNNARNQCRQLGFMNEPTLVPNSGMCSAWYKNRLWTAHCESEFDCGF